MKLHVIPDALRRALFQLWDPRILGVVVVSLGIMLLITAPFALIFIGVAWLIELITPAHLELPWLGDVGFLGVMTKGLTSQASWVFWTYVMAPLAVAIIGLFLDRIVNAVERRHFPSLPPVANRTMAEMALYALRFFGLMMMVNLGALVASLFAGALAPVVFIAANGFLLAREYYETVAMRRVGIADMAEMRRRNFSTLWVTGALLALGLAVPFLNLLIPVIGAATYTHLFHRLG